MGFSGGDQYPVAEAPALVHASAEGGSVT